MSWQILKNVSKTLKKICGHYLRVNTSTYISRQYRCLLIGWVNNFCRFHKLWQNLPNMSWRHVDHLTVIKSKSKWYITFPSVCPNKIYNAVLYIEHLYDLKMMAVWPSALRKISENSTVTNWDKIVL